MTTSGSAPAGWWCKMRQWWMERVVAEAQDLLLSESRSRHEHIARQVRKNGTALFYSTLNEDLQMILDHSGISNSKYNPPPWWGKSAFAQMISMNNFREKQHHLPWKRHEIPTEDGGTLHCDILDSTDENANDPVFVILPGLTGGTHEQYVTYLADYAQKHYGFRRVAVLIYRGVSGTMLTSPITFCATRTKDDADIIHWIKNKYPNAEMVACGFSLGSIKLIRYLAEFRGRHPFLAAVSISNPMDLEVASMELGWIYNKRMTHNLKKLVTKNWDVLKLHPDLNMNEIAQCKSVREFDEAVTCRIHGFRTCDEYYREASPISRLDVVDVPLLCINAIDDPVAPLDALHVGDYSQLVEHNPNLAFLLTKHGAHLAFFQPASSFSNSMNQPTFVEDIAPAFLRSVLERKEKLL